MSRAGWFSSKFNAVKLCQSSSISGPSATVKDRRSKISTILFLIKVTGCLLPEGMGIPGRDTSILNPVTTFNDSMRSFSASNLASANILKAFKVWPNDFFCSTGTFFISPIIALTIPFTPRKRILNCSRLSVSTAVNRLISLL